ncbi:MULTISPECIES: DUF819 family protein [unclassified Oleiphilus]|uniref:DUF819 family protein n=5 Tax=Oleiphilus TaxID=141450 RepID=UPI0007C3C87D|nr:MULTISPECIES: DUF819 family protein [unclassified Oleiphilus]KZY44407.1 hypothetical protein A3732_12465 [Oleiphilus sp. HI0050]KZY83644.1 hypothetical protein A3740_05270 [Oleiphilus sp. HI0068]KZZ13608.1 hypothetical protein A3749_05705 [Oleiphilus sp. HI0078]KZY33224.1 hypothetical protein A3729_07140 [Oleiphilus sp. HI0043]KZY58942.1 hypothetical protein A3735_16570 [Oleiphilus sp. HI0061]
MGIFFILVLLSFPAVLIVAAQRWAILDKLGVVVLAFASGIVLSGFNIQNYLPGSDVLSIQTQVTEVAIALAIPMLAFSMDIKSAFHLAGPTIKAMILALFSVMIITTILSLLFDGRIEHLWQVAGLAVGAYTGGGPNMAAISAAIEGEQSVFITMTSYDILLSALYLLFVVSLAKPLFSRFLKAFNESEKLPLNSTSGGGLFDHLSDESSHAYKQLVSKENVLNVASVLGFAVLALVIGIGLSQLFPKSMSSVVTIVAITSAGLGLSFFPQVKRLKQSFHCGMYLVLVFCFTMGTMTNLEILSALNVELFLFIALLLVGTLILHASLCKLFKVDTDTFLISSAAAIMSVPFIPVVAGALKNKSLIVPGFAAAILGYILGNYLGITLAYLIRWLSS